MFRLLQGNEGAGPPRKRKRPVVSCTECHRRKQKCDRRQPCLHCIRRNKAGLCFYELPDMQPTFVGDPAVGADTTGGTSRTGTGLSTSVCMPHSITPPSQSSSTSTSDGCVAHSLGYANDATGTLGIIQSLGGLDHGPTTAEPRPAGDAALQYKTLVRQLPPGRQTDTLVRFFFAELAWQYDIVEEEPFRRHLHTWDQVSYEARSQPSSLSGDMKYFPALLFQVLAQALLFQPMRHDASLDDLRHAPDMDLVDLAVEYSDAGHQVASMFGSRDVALAKVQAGLLRACFEKTMGSVVEAWHTLGGAIRDAQELGLHRLGAPGESTHAAAGCEKTQRDGVGWKLWLVLHLWDGHMAVVLGRPMATELDPDNVPFPGGEPSHGRGCDGQHPAPLDVILCGYHTAYRYLQEIHRLGSAKPDAHERVDAIHAAIMAGISRLPAWARSRSWQHDERHPWLPAARETLMTEVYFTLLALHRPFVLSRPRSRAEALKAALRILESQSRLFSNSAPRHHMAFNLVFATFDAVVMVAATYILFPGEHPTHLEDSLRGVRWALERLHAMKARNRMAGSAHRVLQVLYGKLLNRLSAGNALELNQASCPAAEAHSVALGDLSNMTPPLPLHDLAFQDCSADLDPGEANGGPGIGDPGEGDDFWRIISDLGVDF